VISKYDEDDLTYSLKRWTDRTGKEMYTFIALLMLMARNKCNCLKEYWSEDVQLQNFLGNYGKRQVSLNSQNAPFFK
jgi:hypothetical protein